MPAVATFVIRLILAMVLVVLFLLVWDRSDAFLPDHWTVKAAPFVLAAGLLAYVIRSGPPLQPRTKKLIGMLLFAPVMLLYIGIVLWVSDKLPENGLVYLIFYVVAGTAWAFPLKPIFGWMNAPAPTVPHG